MRSSVSRVIRLVALWGATLLGLSLAAGAASAAGLPSRAHQIATLKATLAHIKRDYAHLDDTAEIGPGDILGYGIGALWSRGIDGAGTTVALLEGWKDPDIAAYANSFDKEYDLPAAQISTIYPTGALPKTCPHQMQRLGGYGACYDWRYELRLDVSSVHLIAPYAKILLVVAPADAAHADDAEGVAPAQMMEALEDIAAKHLANVVSVSDGSGESTYSHGAAEITAQDPGELAAAAAGIPFVGGTGDCGAAQALAQNQSYTCQHVTHFRSSSTWADSPWTTAVGGSIPNLNPRTGARLGPDHLWEISTGQGHLHVGEGAGPSSIFARPSYQNGVAAITHSAMRTVPDITMDASDGTSQATPLFAGVLALATQENGGHDLGPINPALYAIGPRGSAAGIADVIGGTNNFYDPVTGKVLVWGYTATAGFDIASGWGTVYAPTFVPALVAETRKLGEESAARSQAEAQLQTLTTKLTANYLPASAAQATPELALSASGFLPGYPVSVAIAGTVVATLTANGKGDLDRVVNLPGYSLPATPQAVTATGMLIRETATLTASS